MLKKMLLLLRNKLNQKPWIWRRQGSTNPKIRLEMENYFFFWQLDFLEIFFFSEFWIFADFSMHIFFLVPRFFEFFFLQFLQNQIFTTIINFWKHKNHFKFFFKFTQKSCFYMKITIFWNKRFLWFYKIWFKYYPKYCRCNDKSKK